MAIGEIPHDPARQYDPHYEQTRAHSARLDLFGEEIGDIKADVAGVKADVKGMSHQVDSGFAAVQATLHSLQTPKPDKSGLALAVAGALGAVLAFVFGVITNNMQRENDLRFAYMDKSLESVVGAATESHTTISAGIMKLSEQVNNRFAVLDANALKAAYDNGVRDEHMENNSDQFKHHDAQQHLTDRTLDQFKLDTIKSQSINETGLRATGEYAKEHAAKEGGAGHPIPERIITAPNKLAVDN